MNTAESASQPALNKFFLIFLAGLPVALLVIVALTQARKSPPGDAQAVAPERPQPLPILSEVMDFQMTERSGKSVGLKDLKGKIWLASFVFTRCKGPCPLIAQRMAQLQERLQTQRALQLVTFTMDPEYDTPEVLSRFAEQYNADPERWWFLSGAKSGVSVYDLSRMSFKLAADHTPDNEIVHSDRVALVDRLGRVRALIRTGEDGAIEEIVRAVSLLVHEQP